MEDRMTEGVQKPLCISGVEKDRVSQQYNFFLKIFLMQKKSIR